MGYANILVALSGADDDKATLAGAADLAKASNGVARILMALPVETASVWAAGFGATYLAADTLRAVSEVNATIRKRTIDLAKSIAAEKGMTYGGGESAGRIEMTDPRDTAWLSLVREAPMADLLVVGDATTRAEGFWSGLAAEALFYTRTPVLVVRPGPPLKGCVAAIAWDGSLPAGRAVRAAMPLLSAANRVVILRNPDGLSEAELDPSDPFKLTADLARRGLKAVAIAEVGGGHEGARLLEAAKSMGAGLIVSGGYGHSRLGEAVFGGATREFVRARIQAHHFLAH